MHDRCRLHMPISMPLRTAEHKIEMDALGLDIRAHLFERAAMQGPSRTWANNRNDSKPSCSSGPPSSKSLCVRAPCLVSINALKRVSIAIGPQNTRDATRRGITKGPMPHSNDIVADENCAPA